MDSLSFAILILIDNDSMLKTKYTFYEAETRRLAYE